MDSTWSTGLRPGLRAAAAVLVGLLVLLSAPGIHGRPTVLHRQVDRQPVTDGVELIRIRQLDERGWLNIFVLEVDHTRPHLYLDALLGKDRLTGFQPLSETVAARGALAAINGDFFHIRTTGAPIAGHIQSGELFKSFPRGERALAVGIKGGNGSIPFIGPVDFRGRVTNSTGMERALDGWNLPAIPANGLVAYNHRWGPEAPGPTGLDMARWPNLVHAVVDADGRVTRLLRGRPGPAVPENGLVLLGRGSGARWLVRQAGPGEQLEITRTFAPAELTAAIGGFPVLIADGAIAVDPNPRDIHPRTAIGHDRDRTRSWLVAVDGRSPLSRGVDLHELAALLQEFGAHQALNLDGGGTTTLIARTAGGAAPAVQNIPSDGGERSMPNGLGIFNTAPTGPMEKLFLIPPAPRDPWTVEPEELRLAPGTFLQPLAVATDTHLNPVPLPGPIAWSVTPGRLGTFTPDGVFHAREPGLGHIHASVSTDSGQAEASLPLRVIERPVSLEIVPREIILSPGEAVDLAVRAVDARGYSAPLAADQLNWETRGEIGRITGGRLVAGEKTGSGALQAGYGDLRAIVPVGIGDRPVLVSDFSQPEEWGASSVPEEVTADLAAAAQPPFLRNGSPSVKLAYDFTGTTRTRAAYLRPRGGRLELPGRPLRLGVWVYGDNRNGWLRGHLVDAGGITRTLDFARNIDWTGWRYLQTEIPPGMDFPVALSSIYVVETRPDVHYSGAVYFNEILAIHAPHIDPALLTGASPVFDPANRPPPESADGQEAFRFIVFGDSKIAAAVPDSPEARILGALIDRINREEAEFVLFTGDLIEHDTEENYRLGKEFLDRLNHPYFLAVANHEIAGTGSYQRYRETFGPTYFHFSRGSSEFIVLNTARPGLRASEPEQWTWLQERLAETTAESLFLLTHTPVVDPIPGGTTGWSDPSEAALFQRLLSREVDRERNVYVFHGHVHGFHRRAFEGVQFLTSAGAGSSLYLPPEKGGFFHYVVVTVQGREITYQVIPLLERIELPERIAATVGEVAVLEAYGIAPGDLVRFPLRSPAAVRWTVADPGVADIDPATGTLHPLRPGETEITLESGGLRVSARVSVRE